MSRDVLTKEYLHTLFEYREGVLLSKRTGQSVGWVNDKGYVRVYVDGYRDFCRSNIVWIMHNGDIPKGFEIDHINRNKSDDRIENLRLADKSLQNFNKGVQANNRLGVQGVTRGCSKSKPFKAVFRGKFLGNFQTVEEASQAYQSAKQEYLRVRFSDKLRP